ncbi:MAG: VWA domain-containing protein [Gemmatimonadota bacterium]
MRCYLLSAAVAALVLLPAAGAAQIEIKNPYGSSGKGKVYGLDVTRYDNLVFVVDFSGSMESETGGMTERTVASEAESKLGGLIGGRAGGKLQDEMAKRRKKIEEAKREVAGAVEGLGEEQHFGIVYFEDTPHLWKDELVLAEEDVRKAASKFIKKAQGGGGTGIRQAMELAFSLEPETIVLVTDGEPTDASPEEILQRISELNPDGAVVVHAVGVGEDHDRDFMSDVAEQNGGEYLTRGAGI